MGQLAKAHNLPELCIEKNEDWWGLIYRLCFHSLTVTLKAKNNNNNNKTTRFEVLATQRTWQRLHEGKLT